MGLTFEKNDVDGKYIKNACRYPFDYWGRRFKRFK